MDFKSLIKKHIFGFEKDKKNDDDKIVTTIPEEPHIDEYLSILRNKKDRNKVWAFYAGQSSDDFRGNPKYLFIYINYYRKDITAYWMCQSEETLEFVRNLGYLAFLENTAEGQEVMDYTGVIVAEQVKNTIPRGFKDVKYLNLYHGIGGKQVERVLTEGLLANVLAKKYILNNSFYRDRQLFLATSDITCKNFEKMCGIDSDKLIRGGYPRCLYQKYFDRIETFSHDILGEKGLPSDTKIAVYAPTFRKDTKDNVFTTAFPDLDRLVEVCRDYHYLMVFKMHPIMEDDPQYLLAKKAYKDCPYLYFWDNKNDFYEMIDKVDLGIVDYSSIFTDMLDAGVTHFLRYIYDFETYKGNLTDPYDDITAGIKCMTYEDLLENMKLYHRTRVPSGELEPIIKRFWQYSGKDTFENIINRTLEFIPEDRERKSLYSFDIFDTLISRKVLDPVGIFYYVKEMMKRSDMDFPIYLIDGYPELRANCEHNVREYYAKTQKQRNDLRKEIQFDEIFDRMKDLYDLDDEQIDLLKRWELEAELENVIPVPENVDRCLELFHRGESVFLISDMYLPKSFIQKMLSEVSEELAQIPIYLSSDCGWQKTTGMLFMEVYKQYGPDYDFKSWIHTGDNELADRKMPKRLGIQTIHVEKPCFDEYEQKLVDDIGTYDAYLIAGNMARFRLTHDIKREQFSYEYVSLYMVPYVDWAIHKAVERGDKCAYFISRDGHHLKKIADVIIEAEGLPIKTKYIYASRKTWRVPSFIHDIDEEFWDTFGNFGGVNSFKKLLAALRMNENQFRQMFPELQNITKETKLTREMVSELTECFRQSEAYRNYIMEFAAEKRISCCGYLKQEIDPDEQFSMIEYWGRGYTQDCFVNLWHHITGKNEDVPFYYARSILPSQGSSIRYNFTSNHTAQIFVEAIFANMNYKSIESYHLEDGKYQPDIVQINCDQKFLEAMEKYLPEFTRDYTESHFIDRSSLHKELFDFSLNYYADNPTNPLFLDIVAPLIDSVSLYGKKQEFAKAFTMEDLDDFVDGVPRLRKTRNIKMSVARSNVLVRERYMELYQIQNDDEIHMNSILKPRDLETSRQYNLKYEDLERLSNEIGEAYDRFYKQKLISNMVLFCGKGDIAENTSFRRIYRMLKEDSSLTVEEIDFNNKKLDIRHSAELMSRAPVIIICQPLGEMSKIHFRNETKLIHLGEAAFNYFMHEGFNLKNKQKLSDLNYSVPVRTMQVSSENMIPVLKKHWNLDGSVDFSLKGCCQTDVYYDENERTAAREKLIGLLPEAGNRKIIFYMPHARYRSKTADYFETVNMHLLKEELEDDYFVIMHLPTRLRNNKNLNLEYPGFSVDLTNKMYLREQIMVADIIVGDYRDSIFEATLTGKPIFITCSDKESVKKNASYFNYDDVIPGVEVGSDNELIQKILHLEEYDDSNSKQFREKYLTYCDGKSAERLYDYVKKYVSVP